MKRTVLFCVVSAVAGAMLALLLTRPPDFFGESFAEEPPGSVRASGAGRPQVEIGAGTRSGGKPPSDGDLTPQERVNIAVYENVNRSVVNITTKSVQGDSFFWFSEAPAKGEGSGMMISREGHVLTNSHVIDGAREIQVTLFDGKTYDGRLVGQDPTTDVAVLQIDAPEESLFPAVFGDSSRLRVGQNAYAIGNPFGLERTLSTGVVSSLNRMLPSRRKYRSIQQIIQIDASINPGNSGGPLLDSRGRMIGMNTAIASRTGESAGVGFAIPVNTIARIVPQLIENGRVVRADVGIAEVYQTDEGLLIATLAPGGAAERAGLKGFQVVVRRGRDRLYTYERRYIDRSAADLIVGVDGKPVRTVEAFLAIIESKAPGEVVKLNVVREGGRVEVPVELDAGD
jgi:S1-C subfamily serine protease